MQDSERLQKECKRTINENKTIESLGMYDVGKKDAKEIVCGDITIIRQER